MIQRPPRPPYFLGLVVCLFSVSLACAVPSVPRNAPTPRFEIQTGWEMCDPRSSAVLCSLDDGPHWQPVDPNREHKLFFRISEPQDFWLRVVLPDRLSCADPALYFGVINLSFYAYLDGQEIFRFGDPSAGAAGFAGRPFQMIRLPVNRPPGVAADAPRWFTLKMWSGFRNAGIDGGPPVLGCRGDLQREIFTDDLPRLLIGILAIAVGLAVLWLLRRQREWIYPAFSFLCVDVGVYMIANRSVRLQHWLIEWPLLWHHLELVSLYLLPLAIAQFFAVLARPMRPQRYLAILQLIIVLGFLSVQFFGTPMYAIYGTFMYTVLLSSALYFLAIGHAMLYGPPEVRTAIAGILLFFVPGLGDALWAVSILPHWPGPLAQYGFVLLLGSMGLSVWHRYLRIQEDLREAHIELKNHAQNLERQVADRTVELRESLKKVSQLKEQQDGDYLLISRVLDPMVHTQLKRPGLQVDSLVRQYKRFEFRGIPGELGGDLCLAAPLNLNGENYVAWLNGDAMGKSVQGASGAIVLAVAFRAFLHLSADGQVPLSGRPPVEWLLRACEELQRVFRPFEGRMMASLLMGLVHEERGQLYAINAGHPPAVLLRGTDVRFVLERTQDPVGAPDPDAAGDGLPSAVASNANGPTVPIAYIPEQAVIQLELEPGDTLLIGSDGRDDLRPNGNQIDSDPNRFLELAAACGGDLEELARQLERAGLQADDLSLLRLRFG